MVKDQPLKTIRIRIHLTLYLVYVRQRSHTQYYVLSKLKSYLQP